MGSEFRIQDRGMQCEGTEGDRRTWNPSPVEAASFPLASTSNTSLMWEPRAGSMTVSRLSSTSSDAGSGPFTSVSSTGSSCPNAVFSNSATKSNAAFILGQFVTTKTASARGVQLSMLKPEYALIYTLLYSDMKRVVYAHRKSNPNKGFRRALARCFRPNKVTYRQTDIRRKRS